MTQLQYFHQAPRIAFGAETSWCGPCHPKPQDFDSSVYSSWDRRSDKINDKPSRMNIAPTPPKHQPSKLRGHLTACTLQWHTEYYQFLAKWQVRDIIWYDNRTLATISISLENSTELTWHKHPKKMGTFQLLPCLYPTIDGTTKMRGYLTYQSLQRISKCWWTAAMARQRQKWGFRAEFLDIASSSQRPQQEN